MLNKLELKKINEIKKIFNDLLIKKLNLINVPSPLFLKKSSKLNDQLNGVEQPVEFNVKNINDSLEIVHSLAKWKRNILTKYDFNINEGIVCNMLAIRKDEHLDNLHSLLVDQWDWEVVISKEERNIDTLKKYVNAIYDCIKECWIFVKENYKINFNNEIPEKIYFITSQELKNMFPNLSPKEREKEICKLHKAVFIIGIGDKLNCGEVHDSRSPEYDDWKLNGDLLFWLEAIDNAIEISSMGIRVDSKSLNCQLNNNIDVNSKYQYNILNDQLKLTIGGGIGQSRLVMYLLNKKHIGEVQFSCWDNNNEIFNEVLKND